ncbi:MULTISPECIES: hypothetical protein [unclassified Janibacter]|uniref:hypothetical protein n=1 Tax=unclassified Janibacter TaxID=2649294 RepID=UPI003D048290
MQTTTLSRRVRLFAGSAVAALALTGCGLGSSIVGVQDAPTETTTGAAVPAGSAKDLAVTALEAAKKAQEATGKGSWSARSKALAGPALLEAHARAKYRSASEKAIAEVSEPEKAQVLAVSRGTEWPRAILVTTREKNVQSLHALISDDARNPYRLFASVEMAPGASVPSLGELASGSPLVIDGKGMAGSPKSLFRDYAKDMGWPRPRSFAKTVSLGDSFSTAVRKNAAAQRKSLRDLGYYRQRHLLLDEQIIGFRLADGGALAFGSLSRHDTIRSSKSTKRFVLPDDLAKALKVRRAADIVKIRNVETLAMTIPAKKGTARIVGAHEQLASAWTQ